MRHVVFSVVSIFMAAVCHSESCPDLSKPGAGSGSNAGGGASDAGAGKVNDNGCPAGMNRVTGEYCTKVREECAVWKDVPCEVKYSKGCRQKEYARCQTFKPSVCIGERVHKDFCMSVTEYTKPGETLPMNNISWDDLVRICKSEGHRTCRETEFNFACAGEAMNPYATGLERPDGICNIDIDPSLLGPVENRTDYRKSAEETKACKSWAGIINLNGNLDENVEREGTWGQYPNLLKGGHWMPVRDKCLIASTNAHANFFAAPYVGGRCCADPNQ